MKHLRTIGLMLVVAFGGFAFGQNQPSPASPPPHPPQELPWPIKLGVRSHVVSQAFPLIDRVVLVPDAATYVDELSKWSAQGRWPVLIEDAVYAPMFVRRFKPAELIRRSSAEEGARPQITNESLSRIIIRTYGGDPEKVTLEQTFAAQNYVPPGIVLTTLKDPAWTAGFALALGHGQPIAWMNDANQYGGPNDELNDPAAQMLIAEVAAALSQQSYSYKSLGDDIDAITICRSMAVRAIVNLPSSLRNNPGGPHNDGPVAVTDLLGRNEDGTRFALVGWVFGDEVRSAYIAMCSLFLDRDRALLFNTYPNENTWRSHALHDAQKVFKAGGYSAPHLSGETPAQVDDRAWQRMLIGGFSTDVLFMNTKGNNDFFDLLTGQCFPDDVPVLNEPLALHLIHSWSMQFPDRADTVGGQWLRHGTYAMVGSCHEPYLAAFVPPAEVANRAMNFVPFLVAARWWDGQGPLHKPWRVVTIGDPLMVIGPVEQNRKQRVTQKANYGVDLNERVKELIRQTEADASGQSFAEAIAILNMLGKDDVAIGAWRLAVKQRVSAACARAALDPLFRRREVEEFIVAFDQVRTPDELAVDMLWHLCTPRLSFGQPSNEMLLMLQSNVRQPFPHRDLARLVPALKRSFGQAQVQSLLEREMAKATNTSAKSAIAELLRGQ